MRSITVRPDTRASLSNSTPSRTLCGRKPVRSAPPSLENGKETKTFHKGDRVQFKMGINLVRGTVQEDRGPIGVGGRRLYLVVFPGYDAASQIELPGQDLAYAIIPKGIRVLHKRFGNKGVTRADEKNGRVAVHQDDGRNSNWAAEDVEEPFSGVELISQEFHGSKP